MNFPPASMSVLAWFRGVMRTGPDEVGNTWVWSSACEKDGKNRTEQMRHSGFMVNLRDNQSSGNHTGSALSLVKWGRGFRSGTCSRFIPKRLGQGGCAVFLPGHEKYVVVPHEKRLTTCY